MKPTRFFIISAVALLAACSSEPTSNNSNNANNGADAGQDADIVADAGSGSDAAEADTGGQDASGADAGSDCIQATVDPQTFDLTYADDVSIEYSLDVDQFIEGESKELSFLFERYIDGTYQGTAELGVGANDNFGTCPNCVFVRGDSAVRAFFADQGTLVMNRDVFSRRGDIEVSNLRLIEVTVDGADRSSTPVPDGVCIEFSDFEAQGVFPVGGWVCPAEQYNDRVECNCGCGAVDPDCGGAIECLPGDPGCSPRDELPVVGCIDEQVCAFEPITMANVCTEPCDWDMRDGCSSGTCVFDFGSGDGDLCVDDPNRVESGTMLGDDCADTPLQAVCNVVDGFAEGWCGPNGMCRPLCVSDDECTVDGETCRFFLPDEPFGYCGPEPTDPDDG